MKGAPTVYVVQEPRYKDGNGGFKSIDMTPALDFGRIELLIEDAGFQTYMYNSAAMVRKLAGKLKDYSDADFILAAGDPVAIGVACSIAAAANNGKYTILKWDRRQMRYYPVFVNLLEAM